MADDAQEIITDALIDLGATAEDETPSATKLAFGLRKLNQLLYDLSLGPLAVPTLTKEDLTLAASAISYAIGDGQTLDTPHPIRLHDAQYKSGEGWYSVLEIITAEEFGNLPHKNQAATPTKVFYNRGESAGTIYFDYKPPAGSALSLASWKPLTTFATVGTAWSGPDEFKPYLTAELAIRLAPSQKTSAARVLEIKAIRDEIKDRLETTYALARVPHLEMPPDLSRNSGRSSNILTGD